MKLRFDVDQAESFRRGIDCPKSIVTVDVDPANLSQADRDLIAARMDGIDICELGAVEGKLEKLFHHSKATDPYTNFIIDKAKPARIIAKLPTFDALMEAIQENQAKVEKELNAAKNHKIANVLLKATKAKNHVNAAEILDEKARS